MVVGMSIPHRKYYVRNVYRITTPRICPGRHLSNDSLYAVVSSVLAAFDVKPPLDADGKPSRLSTDVKGGLISYTFNYADFEYKLTAR